MRYRRAVFVFLALVLMRLGELHASSYSFQGLGDFPGGLFQSEAAAVSADGSVVVSYGTVDSDLEMGFRWTRDTGMVPIGFLSNGYLSIASGVSADGTVITGWNENGAFRWTAATGMVNIGNLGGSTTAYGISADGSVIVGVD
jgi:probable HAF family extracellular repeat protein